MGEKFFFWFCFCNMFLSKGATLFHDPVERKQVRSYRKHIFHMQVEAFYRITVWNLSLLRMRHGESEEPLKL